MNDLASPADDAASGAPAGHRELRELLEGYASLSRSYVDARDSRMAMLAMWTADVHALQLLLLESGLDRAPDPAAQLAGVGEAVNRSLAEISLDDATPRQLVERSREALVATFDQSVHAMLTSRFLPLDHLDAATAPTGDAPDRAVQRRLGGRTYAQLVADLEATAGDCAAVAGRMLVAGDVEAALRQMHQADLATFEAFLLHTATEAGDETLASVDLSWDLAARAYAQAASEPAGTGDVAASVNAWRERLVVFGGWAHAAHLRASFLPVPLG